MQLGRKIAESLYAKLSAFEKRTDKRLVKLKEEIKYKRRWKFL